jgi:5'-deoxynucleotidase YfbR-like HD superfamily hydrolase
MNTKALDGIYEFMAKAYQGNWQYRFVDAPYMRDANASGHMESVLAHEWACMAFWFQLRRVSKKLDKVVNSLKLYEMLLNHDLGETVKGDLPAHKFIEDESVDKASSKVSEEEEEIKQLGKDLPVDNIDSILSLFDEMERQPEDIDTIEALVAKYLDGYSGMHFALVFGNDLGENSQVLIKIVNDFFIRYSEHLINRLNKTDKKEAAKEVEEISAHIIKKWQNVGVNIAT